MPAAATSREKGPRKESVLVTDEFSRRVKEGMARRKREDKAINARSKSSKKRQAA